MWNPFRSQPTCPIDEQMRRWVDQRFAWLQAQLGEDTPAKVRVILPSPEFFPDAYEAKKADAQRMLVRVAGYMGVDPQRCELFLFSDGHIHITGTGATSSTGPAGLYRNAGLSDQTRKAQIGIEQRQLADPLTLVATLAHEIGHEILLGEGRISPDAPDHEPLTDLITVFLGMGIFTANSTVRDAGWRSGSWAGWRVSSLGYLDQPTFGYALARFAMARGEPNPRWIKAVRPDVRAPMKQALRFLAASIAD